MATNKLTEVAGLVAHAVMGATIKDKDGNDKIIKPDGNANYLDLRDIVAGSSGTGGGDNPENPDNPSAGADYYAGSLADGEITERNLEWSGTDDPTKDLTVTFKDDPGSNPFGQYSGLTILGHIQKTVMTSGTKGSVSNLELNYDPNNVAKDGYFTTTSSYPIYIKQSDLIVGNKLAVPLNGIGENLSGENTKAPLIYLTLNEDKTMTINHETGFNNDGSTSGATGANYNFVVEVIATFSKQKAVAQLPSSVNLFSGQSYEAALAGLTDYSENSMDGLEVTFDSYMYDTNNGSPYYRASSSSVSSKNVVRIPKEYLINGYTYQLNIPINKVASAMESNKLYVDKNQSGWKFDTYSEDYFNGVKTWTVKIGKVSITDNVEIKINEIIGQSTSEYLWYWPIAKVTTYKD